MTANNMVETLEQYYKSHNAKKVIFYIGPRQIRLTKNGFYEDVIDEGVLRTLDPKCTIEVNTSSKDSKISTPMFDTVGNITKVVIY